MNRDLLNEITRAFVIVLMMFGMSTVLTTRDLHAQSFPFDGEGWVFQGDYKVESYKGAESLVLQSGASASLPGVDFKNGVIEYDVAIERNRGFILTQFRKQDGQNYEEYYLRPHQSGNPDAMQYTPVYNGFSGWQLYHGENHSNTYHFKENEWMHIKLVIVDSQMEVFIDNMNIPILHVFDLKRTVASGSFAFAASLMQARFANLEIKPTDSHNFVSTYKSVPEHAPEMVGTWEVSTAFSNTALGHTLSRKLVDDLEWQTLESEYTGIINLAQANAREDGKNTVFAKFTVTSDRDQVKQLALGYSDIVRIYGNNKAIYEGQHIFRSRDYRYLGTVGYFDSVFLDLKRGKNEVWFAVTENFGGWGAMAKFTDLDGISLE